MSAIETDVRTSAFTWRATAGLLALAVIVRLLALHWSTLDSGDSVSRMLLGWLWGDDPFYIHAGGWGPLHFYSIGAVMRFWPDPIWAPAALHMVCGVLTSLGLYKVAYEMTGSARAGLLGGIAGMLYPMLVLGSVEAHSEVIFGMFLAFALLYLVRAAKPEGRLSDAIIAGIMIGLGSMLRYEAWMMLPFLTLPLLWRWRQIFGFLIPAMIHPTAWMIGSMIEYGNPLYSFFWSSNYERKVMGNVVTPSLAGTLEDIWQFVMTTVHGLSIPITLLLAFGALWAVLQRRREALWLLAPLGLFLLMLIAAAGGSMWVKPTYTITFGVLLVPYVAFAFTALHVDRWSRAQFTAMGVALTVGIGITMIEPLWDHIPKGRFFFARAHAGFTEERETKSVVKLVEAARGGGNGPLIADFIGWQPSGYLIQQTRTHPELLCAANGAPVPVDVPSVRNFLGKHPEGVLVMRNNGRFKDQLVRHPDGSSTFGGVPVELVKTGEFAWPGAADAADVLPGTIDVLRYRVIPPLPAPIAAPASCSMSCPVSFCKA